MEVVEFDECMHGLTSKDEIRTAPAQKGTQLLTNMQVAHVVLSKCCTHDHTQVQLKSNVSKATQEDPAEFCCAILETLRLQQDYCVGVKFLGDEDGLCGGLGKDENLVMKDELHEETDA